MLDFTKPVFTLSGKSVEILKTDMRGRYQIVGVVTNDDGTQDADFWTTNGNYHFDLTHSSMNLTNKDTSYDDDSIPK